MGNKNLGQWLYTLVGVMVLIKTEGLGVDITYVDSAVAKGAVCLDGSSPAYQFDKGLGKGVNNWLVHLEGGGWCDSIETCRQRMTGPKGSSKHMLKRNFTAILSNNKELNPNFYNWNRIFVRYCDGSSFTGDVEDVDPDFKIHFRGARIFDAIMEELLTKGMKNASNALLSGCSAGGLASILHCDKFRDMLPMRTKVKCLSDAGYFIHIKDASGAYHFEAKFDNIVKLHGSAKYLPPYCTSKMKHGLCFYPQYVAPKIRTPLFVINSAYDTFQVSFNLAASQTGPGGPWVGCQFDLQKCSHSQIKTLKDFKSKFLHAISTGLGNYSSRGMFINTCHTHCQSQYQIKWFGDHSSKLDTKAIGEVVGDWYYNRRNAIRHIDYKHGLPHWCVFDPIEPNPKNNYTWPR